MFLLTLQCVSILLLYCVPGYITVKTKIVKESAIPSFATLLMYVCQPVLSVYAFTKVKFTPKIAAQTGIVFLLGLFIMGAVLFIFAAFFHKKFDDPNIRVTNLCAALGNCTFMGLPIVETLLPKYPQADIFSMAFFIAMSVIGWTVGSALITRDLKYIKPKKIFLNPAVLSLIVALPIFFFGIKLPAGLQNAVNLVGKMSTPLCMMIVGMRLATVPLKQVFTDKMQYLAVFSKQILMPLFALFILSFLPLDSELKLTVYILASCPIAAVVLTFAEMLGEGQKSAANGVLLGTILSVVTMPMMLMLV